MGCSLEAAWRAGEGLEEDGHALRGPHYKNSKHKRPTVRFTSRGFAMAARG